MGPTRFLPCSVPLALALASPGCLGPASDLPSSTPSQTADIVLSDADVATPVGQFGALLGEPCSSSAPCRPGLVCADGACSATGDRDEGSSCWITAECGPALACSIAGVCVPQGEGELGDACAVAEDCLAGLRCDYHGFGGVCAPAGEQDVYMACGSSEDCQAGTLCDQGEGHCAHPGQIVQRWLELRDCPEDGGPARIYFEVPRPGDTPTEFYRLPFPTDVRRTATGIDLRGHSTLPFGLFGFDPVARVVDSLRTDADGYATAANALFRASRTLEVNSGVVTSDREGEPPRDTLAIVDITPGSPDYGERMPVAWSMLTGKGSGGRYICDDWVSIRPLWVRPLRPGHTYAALILDGLAAADGARFGRDADFEQMMAAQPPADADLAAAWQAHAPLRAFVSDASIALPVAADRVVAAAVFTTADPAPRIAGLREAVQAGPAPALSSVVRCDTGVTSPCETIAEPDGSEVRCLPEGPHFIELHARVTLPIFQHGVAPYLEPEDGGAFVFGDDGRPTLAGSHETCLSLTVPKGAPMPAGGWPVVIYAHGTGGRFNGAATSGLAELLSAVETEYGTARFAVLSADGVQHGDRRGDSALPPDVLFFNFANPPAALGNSLQGVADLFQIERLAAGLEWPAAESPTQQLLRLNPDRLYLLGHSQGANVGTIYLAHSLRARGGVLSGAGGGLSLSLLHKRKPTDIASALGIGLGDVRPSGESRVNDHHPALALLQHAFHAVDPLTHALSLAREPVPPAEPKHVAHLWGVGDHYTPDPTIKALAGGMRVAQVTPLVDPIPGAAQLAPPVRDTHGGVTVVTTDWEPDGDYDGHFVLFRHQGAQRQAARFLGSAALDPEGIPTLVP